MDGVGFDPADVRVIVCVSLCVHAYTYTRVSKCIRGFKGRGGDLTGISKMCQSAIETLRVPKVFK